MFYRDPFNDKVNNNRPKDELMRNIMYKEQYYPMHWEINNKVIYDDVDFYLSLVDLNKKMLRKYYVDRIEIEDVLINFISAITKMEFLRCDSFPYNMKKIVKRLKTY